MKSTHGPRTPHPGRPRLSWGALFLILAPLLGAGCATAPDALFTPASANYSESAGVTGESVAAKELAIAKRRMQAGEYSAVLPRLHQVIERYPGTSAAVEARYLMGVTYYKINGYADALAQFQEYLARAPEGPYAEPSRAYVDLLTEEVRTRYASAEDLEMRLAQARARVEENPDELAYQLDLADSLWRTERYAEAGAVYEAILRQWPDLQNDMTIRTRVQRDPAGGLAVLTPAEQVRQQAETDPLVIFNTRSFRSGRNTIYARSYQDVYYNVSGRAVNRGEEPLQDVRILVTIHGFGGAVFDVQTVNIGAMRPKETRAFSVRFANFDDINNVTHYECVGTYTR